MINAYSTLPKIWFDSTPRQQSGGDDCDCACPVPVKATLELGQTDVQHAKGITYRQSPALYWQECGEGHWLVCSPMGAGRIVVLDQSSYLLFELFQSPITLVEVTRAVSELPPAVVHATMAQFLRLGLLVDVNTPAPKRGSPCV